MKLLFDQNISFRLVKEINKTFLLAASTKTHNLIDASDIEIWKFAKKNNYTIVTFDADFLEIGTLYGTPPKIILLKTGNMTTANLASFILGMKNTINSFLEDEDLGFLLLSQKEPEK